MRTAIRSLLPPFLSRVPRFRGLGRAVLILDRLLTDPNDPRSYETVGELNGAFRFRFDLRPWEQKFAFYYRSWETDLIAALRSVYRGGWFIDVGSSLGLWVVCMSDVVRRQGGRIASIEPVPFNLARQALNVSLNGVDALVEYADVAAGARPHRVFLTVDPSGADNNAFISTTGTVAVDVVTLDSLCERRGWSPVGAIKMDVEGYEPEVFKGAVDTIRRDRPPVLAEFNRERMAINGFTIADSWELMRQLEYEAFIVERGTLRAITDPGTHENILFVPCEDQRR